MFFLDMYKWIVKSLAVSPAISPALFPLVEDYRVKQR